MYSFYNKLIEQKNYLAQFKKSQKISNLEQIGIIEYRVGTMSRSEVAILTIENKLWQ